LCLGLRDRRALVAALVLCVGVWFTGSRGAILSLLAAGAVFALRTEGTRAALGLAALGAPLLGAVLWAGPLEALRWLSLRIVPEDHMQDLTGSRLQIWRDCLDLIADAPLLGTGLGTFADAFRTAKTMPQHATVDHAHNDLLQLLVEQGLLGGGLWLAGLGAVTWAAIQRTDRMGAGWLAALAAIGCASLVDFPLQIGALSLLAAVVVGGILSESGPPHSRSLRRGMLAFGALSGLALAARLVVSSPEALTEQGDVAYAAGDTTEANAHYTRALWLAPLSHQALLRLGRQAWADGDTAQAMQVYAVAAEGYPTLLWPWVNLARLHARQGDTAQAHAAWREVLRSNVPDNDDPAPWIAEALRVGPDPVAAALAIAPPRADRQRDIAQALLTELDTPGARDAARSLYASAIGLDPRSRLDYASVLLRWDEPEAALAQLAHFPEEQCRPARLAAKAQERLYRPQAALRRYNQALRSCGASQQERLEAGRVRVQQMAGDPDALAAAEAELAGSPQRDGLRRRVIAGLCAQDPVPTEVVLGHLEHLILNGEPTVSDAQRYSRLIAGEGCTEP